MVYLSRQFNRSGYAVLEALLGSRSCDVRAVVVPPARPSQRRMQRLDRARSAWVERLAYRIRCAREGAKPVRFEGSIPRLAHGADVSVEVVPTLRTADGWARIAAHEPELLVLGGGWPELLPQQVFALAPLGAVNTHPSLLPEYRGTDVHRWQILDGIRTTGVTIHYVDGRFDTGAILGQATVAIGDSSTPQSLFARSAEVSGPLMLEVLDTIGEAAPHRVEETEQPDLGEPSLPKWPWTDDRFLAIDPTHSAARVERLIRASTQESFSYDGPWLVVGGRQFIVRLAALAPTPSAGAPAEPVGTLRRVDRKLLLRCSDGDVELVRLQERGTVPMTTRSMTAARFARRFLDGGRPIRVAAPPEATE